MTDTETAPAAGQQQGGKSPNGDRRSVWLEGKISFGNLLTLGVLMVAIVTSHLNHSHKIKAVEKASSQNAKVNSRNATRISSLSAADTRRSREIVTAIGALRTDMAVQATNASRFEQEMRRDLERLRREVQAVQMRQLGRQPTMMQNIEKGKP